MPYIDIGCCDDLGHQSTFGLCRTSGQMRTGNRECSAMERALDAAPSSPFSSVREGHEVRIYQVV
jgi:hypothetical protein